MDFIENHQEGFLGVSVLFLKKERIGEDSFLMNDIVPIEIKALTKMLFVVFSKRGLSNLPRATYKGHFVIPLNDLLDDRNGGSVNHIPILDRPLKKSILF